MQPFDRLILRPAALAVACCLIVAQVPGGETEEMALACVKSLELPLYEGIRAAGLEGEVVTAVEIGPAGRVGSLGFATVHPAMKRVVQRAVARSSFSERCEGRSVTLVFDFRLEGPPSRVPVTTYRILPPNRIRIVSNPVLPSFY